MDAEALREFDELAAETGRALWRVDVVIGGIAVEATCPQPRATFSLVEGATEAASELVLWVKKSELGSAPVVDAEVTAHGRKWIVRAVTGEADSEAEWCVRADAKN